MDQFVQKQKTRRGWEYSSVVKCMLSPCRALVNEHTHIVGGGGGKDRQEVENITE
jgi:hypothetical protein